MNCPFCDRINARDHVAERATAVAFPDAFPLTPGHTLVVPRRHLALLSQFEPHELTDLWLLGTSLCSELAREHNASGFNLGINLGRSAGQTIEHLHLHVIPRYDGDAEDPRGGIRWVMPGRARYWLDEG
jgi:diadenosine tetraphosphate (Ap4A) HIT family hydrolase